MKRGSKNEQKRMKQVISKHWKYNGYAYEYICIVVISRILHRKLKNLTIKVKKKHVGKCNKILMKNEKNENNK